MRKEANTIELNDKPKQSDVELVIAVKLDAQKLFMFVCGGYKKCIYSPIIFLL